MCLFVLSVQTNKQLLLLLLNITKADHPMETYQLNHCGSHFNLIVFPTYAVLFSMIIFRIYLSDIPTAAIPTIPTLPTCPTFKNISILQVKSLSITSGFLTAGFLTVIFSVFNC